MDIDTYHKLIYSENRARNYLSKKCRKFGHRFCPRCNQRKLYKLKDNRRRCSRCKYTFHDFSGRWINYGRLTCIQRLSLIKLFELELSVRKVAEQMNLAYNTIYHAIQTVRYAILAHAEDAPTLLDGEIELDETYFHGAAHLFFGSLWGMKPKMLGGDPEKAKEHFEKNLQITEGKFLLTYIYYTRFYAAKTLDEELFDQLLTKVNDTPAEVLPGFQLLNMIAKEKAKFLMEKKDELL